MEVIIFGVGVLIGSIVGSLLGILVSKKEFREEIYGYGFTHGYEVAKGNFYNPQAKG